MTIVTPDDLEISGDDTFTPLVVMPLSEPMPGENKVQPPPRRPKSKRFGIRIDEFEEAPPAGHRSKRNAGRKARNRK